MDGGRKSDEGELQKDKARAQRDSQWLDEASGCDEMWKREGWWRVVRGRDLA